MQKEPKEQKAIEELSKKIESAKLRSIPDERNVDKEERTSGSGLAFRVSSDLIAGVIVGAAIGYYTDKWLDTKPLFFIICFFIGVAGAALNIYRTVTLENFDKDE